MVMRGQIKAVATELLISHGVRGLRFGDIGERLGITRANIHYHFGTKGNLVEEVVADYVENTLEQLALIWQAPQLSYQDKARQMMEFNRSRYSKFNRGSQTGRPWSLISRVRLEADQVSPQSRKALRAFTVTIEKYIDDAVAKAQQDGDLIATAPARDLAVQLIAIVDSAGSITMDGGSFDRLERLYTAYLHIIDDAYGGPPKPAAKPTLAAKTQVC